MRYVPKLLVNYRQAKPDAKRTCGNCVMFQKPNRCSLVIGEIRVKDVCNEWAKDTR